MVSGALRCALALALLLSLPPRTTPTLHAKTTVQELFDAALDAHSAQGAASDSTGGAVFVEMRRRQLSHERGMDRLNTVKLAQASGARKRRMEQHAETGAQWLLLAPTPAAASLTGVALCVSVCLCVSLCVSVCLCVSLCVSVSLALPLSPSLLSLRLQARFPFRTSCRRLRRLTVA